MKVPHMGWDYVRICRPSDPFVHGITGDQRYYFVHSYYAVCANKDNVLMECDYGVKFAAAICNGKIYGTQFHPEKSHAFGMRLLENFAKGC